ncbi:MAG TPA: agmatinase [Candidatus Baltobacteraceae bacterium]|nr:agmatinase [Candidatus Baltobacteraceae bacterium]
MKLLNALPPYNMFGLEDQDYKKARVVIVPVPYDSTSTYKAGSREGPHAMIEASRTVELYSEELGKDISGKVGIYTTDELAPDYSSPDNMVKRIEGEVKVILNDKKIPVLIGGEHTISVGSISALSKVSKSFSVLQFDAHSDSRESYQGSRYCHACVMARARELCRSTYSVGIRSMEEGADKRKDVLTMMKMHGMTREKIIKTILDNTEDNIYLTIDLDVLDSSEMPSTGTPEPDGMRFHELKEILRAVLKKKKVIGMDIVELNPIPGFVAPNYLAAKLLYLTLGFAFA